MNNSENTVADLEQDIVILISPPGMIVPQGFPFPPNKFGDNVAVSKVDSVSAIVEAMKQPGVHAFEVPGDLVTLIISLSRYFDVELRSLVGLDGDYPSYWLAAASTLPIAVASELLKTQTNSASVGGDGVIESKRSTPEFKPVDDRATQRRMALLKETAVERVMDAAQVDTDDLDESTKHG